MIDNPNNTSGQSANPQGTHGLLTNNSGVDPSTAKDIYDEIDRVFRELESTNAESGKNVYSPQSNSRVLAHVNARIKAKRNEGEWMKAFVEAPFQYQEAFLSLRTNISFLAVSKKVKKIIITSALPGEGKTSAAVNLSLALSAAGNKVVLIDADLRKPAVHKYMRIPSGNQMGLTNLLRSAYGSSKGCVRSNIDKKGLSVIPCGIIPPNPSELLGSQQMNLLLTQLSEVCDFVIIDTPPVSVVTDAAVLSQFADGVILVVRQRTATFEQTRQAKRNLEVVNANILGVVLNDYNVKKAYKAGGYYHNYYEQYSRRK